MDLALWIIAGLLAAAFLLAGSAKLLLPPARLAQAPGGGWAEDFSPGFVKTLGALEVLGAVGLILPAALDIAPVLVPLAAIGLGIIMVGAAVVMVRRAEPRHALVNLTYLSLALLVAIFRFGPESFTR